MAYKPLRMDKIELIKEYYSKGYSKQRISRLLGISRNTVKKYLNAGLSNDEQISKRDETLQGLLPKIICELGRIGVTRYLLWEEYKSEVPDGFSYSRFCRKLAAYRRKQDVTLRLDHKAAQVMSVDFAGKKIPWVDNKGKIQYAEVLVCTMPYSAKSFAVALASQKQEDFIEGLNQALLYFGGLPKVIQSDNLKSFVVKSDRYEPTFNDLCIQLSSYYGIELSATRVGKPKDKASVERHVGIVYNKVYARLRDQKFTSIRQINMAILPYIDQLNNTKLQGKPYSRNDLFDQDEKPHMPELPARMFEVKKSTRAKVALNSMTVNLSMFTESVSFNNCLNKKISIDKEGYIKNCPSMKNCFGNIHNTKLVDVVNNQEFQAVWKINKDEVNICKVCEYRYACLDCRAFVEDGGNIASKPLKCGYDPFSGKWDSWSTNPLKINQIKFYGMDKIILLLVFLLSIASCKKSSSIVSPQLTKLSGEELIERARVGNFPDINELTYINEVGDTISRDSFVKMDNFEDLAFDDYVDGSGIVRVTLIRRANNKDREVRER